MYSEWPSVRLVRAEAAIGSYLEPPNMRSSPLALCQRKHVTADMLRNVASGRMNRTESGVRSSAICSCQLWSRWHEASGNPFGKQLGNPLGAQEQNLCKLETPQYQFFNTPGLPCLRASKSPRSLHNSILAKRVGGKSRAAKIMRTTTVDSFRWTEIESCFNQNQGRCNCALRTESNCGLSPNRVICSTGHSAGNIHKLYCAAISARS